jgi:hypothetical protein
VRASLLFLDLERRSQDSCVRVLCFELGLVSGLNSTTYPSNSPEPKSRVQTSQFDSHLFAVPTRYKSVFAEMPIVGQFCYVSCEFSSVCAPFVLRFLHICLPNPVLIQEPFSRLKVPAAIPTFCFRLRSIIS